MRLFRFAFIFMILTLTGGLAHARMWGIEIGVPEEKTFNIYAIDNLIDNRPIRYAVSEDVTPEEEQIFKENILKWPAETLRFIRESGRKREFLDIIPILERELVLQRVPLSAPPDIYLEIAEDVDCNGSAACLKLRSGDCFIEKENCAAIFVRVEDRASFPLLTLHEIGHYFGLGDQYSLSRTNSHPEYSSDVDEEESAVMNHGNRITEDDADGFINLLDLRLAQRRNDQFSARARKGWRSLNPKSKNLYQNANTVTRKAVDAVAYVGGENVLFEGRQYSKGKLTGQVNKLLRDPLQIFAVTSSDIVKRDPRTNRITYVRTTLDAVDVLAKEFDKAKSTLIWEKEFEYLSPEYLPSDTEKVMPYIPVYVKQRINGVSINTSEIAIFEGGITVGAYPNFQLSREEYRVKTPSYSIEFTLKDRKIKEFVVDTDQNDWYVGVPGDKSISLSVDGGITYKEYRLPLNETVGLDTKFLISVYEEHRDYLMSFYKNFYAPLFGAQEQQQIRQQVQDSLRTRR